MLLGGNHHSPFALFKNQIMFFEGKELLILNPSPTRFATHLIRIMLTLRHKNTLRGTMNLQEFIAFKLSKEEGTVTMIKENH